MKKLLLAFLAIYLAAILENSFLNYFLIQGESLGLIILAFLIFVLLGRWTKNQLLLLGFWTGLMLDVFCYQGFGLGIISILTLVYLYQRSHRWIKTPKRIAGQATWFIFYNILFYFILKITNVLLVALFPHFFDSITINLFSLSWQLLYNAGITIIILLFYHQGKKIFLR